ncbi:MAG: alanine racemase, partial [Oscillospiraceae bacterium]|nr:alanine racemase [Oscillospiraceae bacterium]
MDFHRRTWAEINLSALRSNIEEIRRAAPKKEIIAVVKANAYGHGDGIVCSQLAKTGVKYFAVSCIDEALHIKDYVRGGEILIFGFMEPEDFKTAAVNNFILTVGSLEYANLLNSFICSQNMKIRVHVKINTGMNRVGIDTYAELEKILSLPGLICGGVYTHFASADSVLEDDVSFTRGQQEKLLSLVRNRGLKTHSQNSGGVLFHPGFEADFVRAGLLLYGLSPNISVPSPMKLSPVMTLKSVIQQIRILEDSAPVS